MFCKKIIATYNPQVVYSIERRSFGLYILPDSNGGVRIVDCPRGMDKEQSENYANKWLIAALRDFEKEYGPAVIT